MPTVLRIGEYRFFFFSREETRMHIHVISPNGEAKFWLIPEVELARSTKFSPRQLREIEKLVREHRELFLDAWKEYFGD